MHSLSSRPVVFADPPSHSPWRHNGHRDRRGCSIHLHLRRRRAAIGRGSTDRHQCSFILEIRISRSTVSALLRPGYVNRHRAGRGPAIAELAVGIVAPTVHCEGCCWAERHAAAYDSAGVVTTCADWTKLRPPATAHWRGTVRRCAIAKLPQVVIPPAVRATYPGPRATCVVGSRADSRSDAFGPLTATSDELFVVVPLPSCPNVFSPEHSAGSGLPGFVMHV